MLLQRNPISTEESRRASRPPIPLQGRCCALGLFVLHVLFHFLPIERLTPYSGYAAQRPTAAASPKIDPADQEIVTLVLQDGRVYIAHHERQLRCRLRCC